MSNLKDWTLSTHLPFMYKGAGLALLEIKDFPLKSEIFGGTKVVRTVLRKGGGQTSSAGVS